MRAIKLATPIELLLVIFEAVFHVSWLPLGGSHIAQVGIVFGTAVVVFELIEAMRRPGAPPSRPQ